MSPSNWLFYVAILLSACARCAPAGEADIVLADFEGADYGAWTATGEAFGAGPAQGTLSNQMPVDGFLGHGLVNTYRGGDGSQGTLTSPPFAIERRYLNFLVGGGAHAGQTCVNLLVDGRSARTATGAENERLDWHTWDLADLTGKMARLEIVDRHTGGWGHINVDHIYLSDERKAEVVSLAKLYDETYRPQFHFTARENWLNDPNGLVYYDGEYHLFFQHNPAGINWGNMTWGHAVSPDLVHWRQLEHALPPDKLGTMFSGSAVVDSRNSGGFASGPHQTLVACYTAAGGTSPESQGQKFTQCLAYSTDRGRTWTKYAGNPVLGHVAGENRDPKVLWHAPSQRWIMALFLDKNDYALFASPDLKSWQHLHNLTVPECGECPDFFEMPLDGQRQDTRWVFTAANGRYLVGRFDGQRFAPESGPHLADWGANYYAVQTYSDIPPQDGRRIQISWMSGGKYPGMPFNQQMSFPCELSLRSTPAGPRIFRQPVKEIESLRGPLRHWAGQRIRPGQDTLGDLEGDLLDLEAEIELASAQQVALVVRGEPVTYDAARQEITCLGRTAPLPLEAGRLKLRVLVDRTSLEVFAGQGQVAFTSCFLPRPQNRRIELAAAGGEATLVSLAAYPLKSAW